jgi:hypothetical protein
MNRNKLKTKKLLVLGIEQLRVVGGAGLVGELDYDEEARKTPLSAKCKGSNESNDERN